jgi:peroxiredoxin
MFGTSGLPQGQRPAKGTLKIGDKAPTFKLDYLKDDKEYDLSSNFGKKPTVLVFGSYT